MSLLYAVPDFCSSPSHNPGADLGGATRLGPPIFTTFAFMTILTVHNIDLKCLLCVYVTVKNNLTKQVLTSTHHTHPLLGRYARSRVWAPLFRNSGSTPETTLPFQSKVKKCVHDTCDFLTKII